MPGEKKKPSLTTPHLESVWVIWGPKKGKKGGGGVRATHCVLE